MDEILLGSRTLQPRRQLLAGGERVALGRRALDIISALAEARGGIVTKNELLEAVWPGVTVEENALQVHIVALRRALGPEADRLKTIRGVGYQLDLENGAAEAPAVAEAALSPPSPAPPSGSLPPLARTPPFGSALTALWAKACAHKIALAVAALLVVLAGAWTLFGSDLGLRPQKRIPVVVRELTATTTGDSTEAALASGITDELIVRLRRIPELRTASARPDGRVEGDTFRDAYVVDGNIRSSGDRLRVTARLIDAKGEILWSQTFDRNFVDLFDVQEQIAAAIARALSVSFDVGADSTEFGGTDNPEAYAAYMQFFSHQLDFDQSVPLRYLERAAALDPDFGKALFGLAINYHNQASVASTRDEAERFLTKLDQTSTRALKAAPGFWMGHVARAAFYLHKKDYSSAERHMRRAAQLDNGDDPQLRTFLAQFAINLGRVEEGASIRQSNEMIDPIYRNDSWRVFDLMMLGRYRESTDLYSRLELSGQGGLEGFAFHAFFAHLLLGSEADADRFAQERGLVFGERLKAFKARNDLLALSDEDLRRSQASQSQIQVSTTALYAAYAGHPELAVKLMRVVLEGPGGGSEFYLWHPLMTEARKTDDFAKLVTDLGFVKVWRESGDWGDYCRPVSATEITCR